MVFKCKMCGGDLRITPGQTVCECEYCGTLQTVPRIDSDKKARLFNRANEYRINNEYDKAYDAYKTIVEEEEEEAEAYWGMILSEYGVEYVEDPKTGRRVPTCHRAQTQRVRSSVNYRMAIQYADSERKLMYQDEAEVLDKLQGSILAVSQKEEPYDVFICYKETEDASGQRTEDSVLAQDIYKELEKVGVRAFFSRISLESHLGENYEPYIYAALQSAKVMLVVTTNGEHCDSVWVKNEWARFLRFMGEDEEKTLIPVYKNMSPYNLPEELSGFQAQDMGKIGALQDLVHGVQKLLGRTATVVQSAKLNELLVDKQEREVREKKRKKTALIVLAVLLVALIAVGSIIGIRVMRTKKGEAYAAQYKKLHLYTSITGSGCYDDICLYLNLMCGITVGPNGESDLTVEQAIRQLEELCANDPGISDSSLTEQAKVAYNWLYALRASSIYQDTKSYKSDMPLYINTRISEQQLMLAKAAMKIAQDNPQFKELYPKEIELAMNGARILEERGRYGAYQEAAKIYSVFAPYEPTAEEALQRILQQHPDALNPVPVYTYNEVHGLAQQYYSLAGWSGYETNGIMAGYYSIGLVGIKPDPSFDGVIQQYRALWQNDPHAFESSTAAIYKAGNWLGWLASTEANLERAITQYSLAGFFENTQEAAKVHFDQDTLKVAAAAIEAYYSFPSDAWDPGACTYAVENIQKAKHAIELLDTIGLHADANVIRDMFSRYEK